MSGTLGPAALDGRGCAKWFLRQQGERVRKDLTVDLYVIIR